MSYKTSQVTCYFARLDIEEMTGLRLRLQVPIAHQHVLSRTMENPQAGLLIRFTMELVISVGYAVHLSP